MNDIPRSRPVSNVALSGSIAAAIIVFATALAMYFVPQDPRAEHAMQTSALAMSIGLLAVPFVRLFNHVSIAARAENVLSFALVYWLLLDLLQGVYSLDVAQETAQLAFLAIGLTAVGIWIGSIRQGWHIPALIMRDLRSRWDERSIFAVAIAAFVLGMLAFAIPSEFDVALMITSLGESRFGAPWSRGQFGGLDAFWDHLQYFGYVLPTLYVLYGRTQSWFNWKAILILLMASIVVAFLAQGGGRRIVGVTIGAALLCAGLSSRTIRLRNALGVVAGAAALLLLLEFMLEYRGVGWGEEVESSSTGLVRVDDNFLRLSQVIELIPDQEPYVYLQYLYYLAARPIPRLFWPGKPSDPGFDLAQAIGSLDVSLSSSMVGEWYSMLGFPAVFVGGLFVGRLAAWINRMLVARDPDVTSMVIPIGIMVLFVGIRSLQDLLVMSYAILGWLLISSVFLKARGLRASSRGRY